MKNQWRRGEDGRFSRDVALAVGWESPRKGWRTSSSDFWATRGPGVMRGGAGVAGGVPSGNKRPSRWDLQDTFTGMVLASF